MRETRNVTVNENAPSDMFNDYVEDEIKSWMLAHKADADADYEVAFFDEDAVGEVSCLVVIHTGGMLWRAWESGSDANAALSKSLENMIIDKEPIKQIH